MKSRHYGIVSYFLVGILPLVLLVIKFVVEVIFNDIPTVELLPQNREIVLLSKTLLYALAVATTDAIVGTLAAFSVWRIGKTSLKKYGWIIFVALTLPICVHSQAWIKCIEAFNRNLNVYIPARGWIVAWLVHSMVYLPIAVIIITSGLIRINRDTIEVARILTNDISVFARIAPGFIKQQIFASVAIIFLLTVNDYAIPAIFSVNVYSMEIFVEYSSSLSASMAFKKSLPVVILEITLLILILDRLHRIFLSGRKAVVLDIEFKLPLHVTLLTGIGIVMAFIQISIPLLVIVTDRAMWKSIGYTIENSMPEILISLVICTLSSLIASPVMYMAAEWLNSYQKNRLAWFLILLPAVISAPLIGTALINMWNMPATEFLYNSIAMPVLAVMMRFMPIGIIIIAAEIKKIDTQLIDVAKIFTPSTIQLFYYIKLPLISHAIVVASAVVFLFGMGELGATVMILPPGLSTVTIRMYDYLHYGALEKVSGLCFILITITLSVTASILFILTRVRGKR